MTNRPAVGNEPRRGPGPTRLRLTAGLAAMAIWRAAAAAATPDEALQSLQAAYLHEDLEAAVASRDFAYEARAVLLAERGLKAPDAELVRSTAEALELGFRKQIKIEGFPDLRDSVCAVVKRKSLTPDLVRLEQECVRQDGSKRRRVLHAARSAADWRMVVLP